MEDDNLEEIIGYPSDEDERTEDETEWETEHLKQNKSQESCNNLPIKAIFWRLRLTISQSDVHCP